VIRSPDQTFHNVSFREIAADEVIDMKGREFVVRLC
jgi:hypothetical protein